MHVLKINLTAPDAPMQFVKSLRETGFAVLTHHPIPLDLVQKVYDEFEEFFRSEDKFTHLFNPENSGTNAGYFPFKSENAKGYDVKDLKEFYHYFPSEGASPVASKDIYDLYRSMERLAVQLLEWAEKAVPKDIGKNFDRPLGDMVKNSANTLVRMLHYPPIEGGEEEGAIRAAAHGDINFITLIPAATAPGLEVCDLQGNWHKVSCDPGEIAVNAGDMLELITQGYFPSTLHRVVNPVGENMRKSRFSMPFFLHAHDEVKLSKDHTRKSYFDQRMLEIGLRSAKAA